jgi:hypothetical protein
MAVRLRGPDLDALASLPALTALPSMLTTPSAASTKDDPATGVRIGSGFRCVLQCAPR